MDNLLIYRALATKVFPVLFVIWTFDLIFLGSGGYYELFGLTPRKYIFLLFFGLSFFLIFVRLRLENRRLLYCWILYSLFFLIWAAIIPLITHGNIAYALNDALPLVGVGLFMIFPEAFSKDGWKKTRTAIVLFVMFFALLHVAIFVAAMMSIELVYPIVEFLKTFMEPLEYDKETSVFLVLQDSGLLRTYFGSSNLLFIGLYCALRELEKKRFLVGGWLLALLCFAFVATLTRSFLIGFVFSVFVFVGFKRYFVRNAPRLTAVYLLISAPFVLSFILIPTMYPDLAASLGFSRGESDDVRWPQMLGLLDRLSESPIFGHGFGQTSYTVSDENAPYAFELTIFSLMMKLGSLGFLAALAIPACVIKGSSNIAYPRYSRSLYATYFGYVISCFFNPYMISLFGTFFFLFLLFEYSHQSEMEINLDDVGEKYFKHGVGLK